MSFHIKRLHDGVHESGGLSQAIAWKEDGTFDSVVGNTPTVGCSMLVGSNTARTYSDQDYWLTTPIIEILEEINNDTVHYVRFRTENSEYEWWTGKYPKTNE